MKTKLSKSLLLAALTAGMALNAQAILITSGTTVPLTFGDNNSNNDILNIIQASPYSVGAELYKENRADGSEAGAFLGSYDTTWGPTSLLDAEFTISYTGGNFISASSVYLLVKDGNNSPNWYLYNISGWNGTEAIRGQNFFGGNQTALSHVALYSPDPTPTGTPPTGTPGTNVPDGGTTVALFGLSLLGLGGMRRMA